MGHFLCKLGSTVRILYCLAMARTFGEYHYSSWTDGINYARYSWRGKDWIVPTSAVEEEYL